MTVQAANPPFNQYTAAPGATVFAYKFKVIRASDMKVTVNGIAMTVGTHFTLSGVGANDGGDITFLAPMVGGEDVIARMDMSFDRQTDYQQNGDFLSPTVNNDFDRLWLAIQQIGQSLKAAIKLPFTTTDDQSLQLSAVQRANKVLAFDADGNLTASTTDAENVALAQAAAAAAEASAASVDAANIVHRTGNETIDGTKTFTSDPVFPSSLLSTLKWTSRGIGEIYWVNDAMAGTEVPPSGSSLFRYVKLTAADAYNSGLFTSETITGAPPLVVATAVITLAGSPLNGRTVNLLNTERRVIRAGSAGAVEQDAFQSHVHSRNSGGLQESILLATGGSNSFAAGGFGVTNATVTSPPSTDGANGTPRTSNETRVKSIGMTAYMRIK